jgi:hypothetical protein
MGKSISYKPLRCILYFSFLAICSRDLIVFLYAVFGGLYYTEKDFSLDGTTRFWKISSGKYRGQGGSLGPSKLCRNVLAYKQGV